MNRIDEWLCEHPVFTDLMTIFVPFLFIVLIGVLSNSCSTVKEIPVETVERIEYRDSLIYVKDTIEIQVPYEVVREVLPDIDTSYLETTVAKSTAYLDTSRRKLHHTLEQKGTIEYVYDTVHVVEYVDRVYEKEVPVEVTVTEYKRDALFWVLVGWAIVCIVYAVLKIYLKR